MYVTFEVKFASG